MDGAPVPPLDLEKEWDDAPGSFAVGGVFLGELVAHHFFFFAQFDPETYEDKNEADHSGDVALLHRSADEHGQEPGVDGMANQAVRTAHNQFVVFFHGDGAAPVASENGPGPQTEGDSANA